MRADSVSLVFLVPADQRPGVLGSCPPPPAPDPSSPPAEAVSCGCDSCSAMSSPPLMGCSCFAAQAVAPRILTSEPRPTQPHPNPFPPPTYTVPATLRVCLLAHTLGPSLRADNTECWSLG